MASHHKKSSENEKVQSASNGRLQHRRELKGPLPARAVEFSRKNSCIRKNATTIDPPSEPKRLMQNPLRT
jgi:hypothetical protein